jgi:hypothetical protein
MKSTALACLLLSAPALAADVVHAPDMYAKAISGAVTRFGAANLRAPSLVALTALGAEGRMAIVANPKSAQLLFAELTRREVSPEMLAAMGPDRQRAILEIAAQAAEREADQIAAVQLEIAERPVKYGAAAEELAASEELKSIAPFLSGADAARAQAARQSVTRHRFVRAELMQKFSRELTGRLINGEITTENLMTRVPEGWVVADEHPEPQAKALKEIYLRRYERMGAGPQGSWTAIEARDLQATLARPEIAAELTAEDVRTLGQMFSDQEKRSGPQWNPALEGRRHVEAVEEFYARALDNYDVGVTGRARITAAIIRGEGEFPSWQALGGLRKSLEARYTRRVWQYLAAALASLPLLSLTSWAVGITLALFVLMLRALWERDSVGQFSAASEALRVRLREYMPK